MVLFPNVLLYYVVSVLTRTPAQLTDLVSVLINVPTCTRYVTDSIGSQHRSF